MADNILHTDQERLIVDYEGYLVTRRQVDQSVFQGLISRQVNRYSIWRDLASESFPEAYIVSRNGYFCVSKVDFHDPIAQKALYFTASPICTDFIAAIPSQHSAPGVRVGS